MKTIRCARACSFLAGVALAMAPTVLQAQARGGQAPAAPAPAAAAAPDMSQVQIKTTKISNNFYTLEGNGGTIGVLTGPDGVLMVDTEFAPLTDKIVAAVKQVSPSPIRFVIDTHVHGDHTGGNENLAKLGATIFGRDELRWRLAHPAPGPNGALRASRAGAFTAEGHLRRPGHVLSEWRTGRGTSHSARAHRWRHHGPLRK